MSTWSPSDSDAGPAGIWRPLRVDVPLRRRRGEAHLLRVRLRDRPGSLASITARLAGHGVDVLGLEVLARGEGFAVDDILVAGAGVEAALSDLGAEVALLAHRRGVDLLDPGLAMAAACRSLTTAGSERETYRQLLSAALGLVFAEGGFLILRQGYGVLRPMASTVAGLPALDAGDASLLSSALASRERLTADGRVPWVAESYRELLPRGAVAVVPGGDEPCFALALIRADSAPFVAAELDRLDALVEVAVGTLALHGAVQRPTGRPVALGSSSRPLR